MKASTVLVVSPHPDDESIGAPVTIRRLRSVGFPVVNLACSLGRTADAPRRQVELRRAAAMAGIELREASPLIPLSSKDASIAAVARVREEVASFLSERDTAIIVSPHPHDAHHAHEAVARGVAQAIASCADPPVWWMYAVWSDLTYPTLYVEVDEAEARSARAVLDVYQGENARNSYQDMVNGAWLRNRVLGEKVFQFGGPRVSDRPYAELLCEVHWDGAHWWLGEPRVLEGGDRGRRGHQRCVDWMFTEPSPWMR